MWNEEMSTIVKCAAGNIAFPAVLLIGVDEYSGNLC